MTEYIRVTDAKEIHDIITEFLPLMPHLEEKQADLLGFSQKLSKFAWVVIAKQDNIPAAFVVFYSNDTESKCGYFTLLATKPEFQGQGLGKALYNFGFDQMKKDGMEFARLEVDCDNPVAIKLNERIGFVYEADTDRNSFYMKKDLKD